MFFERSFSAEIIKDEFRFWLQLVKPALQLPANVLSICEYGFTEILNNVIDHAHAQSVCLRGVQDAGVACLEVRDDGIGVFASLRQYFDLDSDIHALIELVKGKLTVAPEAHSGEGLFFASKMFDRFEIESGELHVTFAGDQCTVRQSARIAGTRIVMSIAENSPRRAEQVFDRFCDAEEMQFYKTRFFVSLAALEGNLVSRSQAKRVAARFEHFGEVELDFAGVDKVGQAFADELLRVWGLQHPNTRLIPVEMNETVSRMVAHIRSRHDLPQPSPLPDRENQNRQDSP